MNFTPLPQIDISRIIGLLEVLDDLGGKIDIYKLAHEIHYEFGELISVIKAAEMLDFVDTPKGEVILEDLGKKLIKSKIEKRKIMLKAQLKTLSIFSFFVDLLKRARKRRVEKDIILERLAILLPHEDSERLFTTIIGWARYAELFGYNDDDKEFYLDQEN